MFPPETEADILPWDSTYPGGAEPQSNAKDPWGPLHTQSAPSAWRYHPLCFNYATSKNIHFWNYTPIMGYLCRVEQSVHDACP